MSARFSVGIDLGTTHCALAEALLASDPPESPKPQAIPQLVARDRIDAAFLLPSFLYFPHASEGALPLPWDPAPRLVAGG